MKNNTIVKTIAPLFSEFNKEYQQTIDLAKKIHGGKIYPKTFLLDKLPYPSDTAYLLTVVSTPNMINELNKIVQAKKDFNSSYQYICNDEAYKNEVRFVKEKLIPVHKDIYIKYCILLNSIIDMNTESSSKKSSYNEWFKGIENIVNILKSENLELYKLAKKHKNGDLFFSEYINLESITKSYESNDNIDLNVIRKKTFLNYISLIFFCVYFNTNIIDDIDNNSKADDTIDEGYTFAMLINESRSFIGTTCTQFTKANIASSYILTDWEKGNSILEKFIELEEKDNHKSFEYIDMIKNNNAIKDFFSHLNISNTIEENFWQIFDVLQNDNAVSLSFINNRIKIFANNHCSKTDYIRVINTKARLIDSMIANNFIYGDFGGENFFTAYDIARAIITVIFYSQKKGLNKLNDDTPFNKCNIILPEINMCTFLCDIISTLSIMYISKYYTYLNICIDEKSHETDNILQLKNKILEQEQEIKKYIADIDCIKSSQQSEIKTSTENLARNNKSLSNKIAILENENFTLKEEIAALENKLASIKRDKILIAQQIEDLLDTDTKTFENAEDKSFEDKISYIKQFTIAFAGDADKALQPIKNLFDFDILNSDRINMTGCKYDMIFITKYCPHSLYYKVRDSKYSMGYAFKLNKEVLVDNIYAQLKAIMS